MIFKMCGCQCLRLPLVTGQVLAGPRSGIPKKVSVADLVVQLRSGFFSRLSMEKRLTSMVTCDNKTHLNMPGILNHNSR